MIVRGFLTFVVFSVGLFLLVGIVVIRFMWLLSFCNMVGVIEVLIFIFYLFLIVLG